MTKISTHASSQLIQRLRQYEPGLRKVYVATVLKKGLLNDANQYLNLLYQDFHAAGIEVDRLVKDDYQKVLFSRLNGEKAIVHYHWFQYSSHKFLKPVVLTFFWLLIFRMTGGKLIWTIHNRWPHIRRYGRFNHILRILFEKLSYRNHVHCHCAVEEMSRILKSGARKFFVVPHPDYSVQLRNREEAVRLLKNKYQQVRNVSQLVDRDRVYLMFGQIREYKGILTVAEIFARLPEQANTKLLIAGSSKEAAYTRKLEQLSLMHPTIILIPEFIPEEDESYFYGLADTVILNHQETLTSGAAILAMNYGKKLLVPRICCLSDLEGARVQIFDDMQELEKLIVQDHSSPA